MAISQNANFKKKDCNFWDKRKTQEDQKKIEQKRKPWKSNRRDKINQQMTRNSMKTKEKRDTFDKTKEGKPNSISN